MKFKTDANYLEATLKEAASALPSSTTMLILEEFHVRPAGSELEVVTTDLEITRRVPLDVEFGGEKPVMLPPVFRQTLSSLSGNPEVIVEVEGQKATMDVAGGGTYEQGVSDGTEYPDVPELDGEADVIRAEGSFLTRRLKKARAFVSEDSLRPAMMGVLLETEPGPKPELKVVATDGHRLAKLERVQNEKRETPFLREVPDERTQTIVPAKAAKILSKTSADEVTIRVGDSHLAATLRHGTLVARLIEEQYPNYESVIPPRDQNRTIIQARQEDLQQTIRRANLYTSSMTNQVRVRIGREELRIQAEDVEKAAEGEESVLATTEVHERDSMPGEDAQEYKREMPFDIGFNGEYLSKILSQIETGDVTIRVDSPNRAALFEPLGTSSTPLPSDEGGEEMYLLMPVMLQEYN